MTVDDLLQWGHRFISVETGTPPELMRGATPASMGPPIYIGGNSRHENHRHPNGGASMGPPIYIGGNKRKKRASASRNLGFNGATDLYRWKPKVGLKPIQKEELASMGPPIYIGGNIRCFRCYRASAECFNGATDLYRWKHFRGKERLAPEILLQWGHRFISVETPTSPR